MTEHEVIMETPQNTVIAEYTPSLQEETETSYQSEAQLEESLLAILESNGYEKVSFHNKSDLEANLKQKLEALNDHSFSAQEWEDFQTQYLWHKNDTLIDKTYKIQKNERYALTLDNGQIKNICILDKKNLQRNHLQVMHQYTEKGEGEQKFHHRYDVTILVNGLPLCHIELKRRGVALREAFNQINRYQRESFQSGDSFFSFVQLFVISNGTNTKYYSNTCRPQAAWGKNKDPLHSFEFTSWWTDAKNERIAQLSDFAKTFLSPHTLLAVIGKYCVFTSDKKLLVMRPYQIVACEAIIHKIQMAYHHKKQGTQDAGGYIWHTTGSGKTLTSFKTAQLATDLGYIDKVLFVVDRKDLDHQTFKEYENFQEGSTHSNRSTHVLARQLGDKTSRIIVTTIQKLDIYVRRHMKDSEPFQKNIVIIFDECHRSQLGSMHANIVRYFKKHYIFGFTGTPIFLDNSTASKSARYKTTEEVFGNQLHAYTIRHAIGDETVLPFRVEFHKTFKSKADVEDKAVYGIDTSKVFLAPQRIREVTEYILKHFKQKTMRDKGVFNSLFAVSSIEMAKLYYAEFMEQQAAKEEKERLKIATIFSYTPNEVENENGLLPEEELDTMQMDSSSQEFLEKAIQDYNRMFGTTYDTTSPENFDSYYKDVSQRMKSCELDLLIVVNMFLTGFDSKQLSTLWVDKNLRYHGLIQAFSRTNRIFNTVKSHGHIVYFRDAQTELDEAISLFGDIRDKEIMVERPYEALYEEYASLVAEFQSLFPLPIGTMTESQEQEFIRLYGKILRSKNTLQCFDQFEGQAILSDRAFQDYQSHYIDLYEKRRPPHQEKEMIQDDLVFELDLIKAVDINIDYILLQIHKYHISSRKQKALFEEQQERESLLTNIEKWMSSQIDLRSKKELIQQFMERLHPESDFDEIWQRFIAEKYEEAVHTLIQEENLKEEETKQFLQKALESGSIKYTGTEFANLVQGGSFFDRQNSKQKRKQRARYKMDILFEKYRGLYRPSSSAVSVSPSLAASESASESSVS